MDRDVYHGILVDVAFEDPGFPASFRSFARHKSGTWVLHGIEIPVRDLAEGITRIQSAMKAGQPYYAHLYNDREVVVVFKDQTFRVTPHADTWQPILEHGRKLNIPEPQLDFWPNRFQDERHYFRPEDFVPAEGG
jgi:hypothetical protein